MTKGTYDYNNLLSYCYNNKIILLKDYKELKVTRDTFIIGNCNTLDCKENFNKTFRQLKVSKNYCELCSKKNRQIKVENTCLIKYGVKSVFECKEIRETMNNIIKEKYGVDNISKLDEIKIKKENTCLKNHGVSVSFKSKEIREKIKETFKSNYGVDNPLKSEIIKEQIKQTNLANFGVENPQQNKEIQNKTKKTCIEKFGVESAILIPEVIQKRKDACFKKYGNEIPLKTELGKQTVKNTCIEKYGVENPQQVPEIAEKTSKNSYTRKKYILPSGKEIMCQGYEPFALDKLIKEEKMSEEDIITGCKNVPQIWYNDESGKKHRHYVDIFIPSQNRCIEVKSTWTARKDKTDNIYLKQNAGKELGYNYEIWIYNNKKEIVELKL